MAESTESLQYMTFDTKGLRYIALRQRVIIICMLVYFGALAIQFFIPWILQLLGQTRMNWALIALFTVGMGFLFLSNVVIVIVCVFGLAKRLFGTALAVVIGILSLVPLVNLVMLLIVNQRATRTLRANGVKVGFFGASGRIV